MKPLSEAIGSVLADHARRYQPLDERAEHLGFLQAVLAFCRDHLGSIKGHFQEPAERIGVPLYCTLIQLGDAIHIVSSNGPSAAVPSLTRQALDAYVDLKNVLTHETYWQRLEVADDQHWNTALQIASAGKNPYFRAISESGLLLEDGRRHHARKLGEWQKAGLKKLEASERFNLAGMKDEYETVWPMLSAYLHNNLSALYSRHYAIREDGPPKEIALSPDKIPYELAGISHVAELLLVASEMIHARCGNKALDTSGIRQALNSHNERVTSQRDSSRPL